MRRLSRPALPPSVADFLETAAAEVDGAADKRATVHRLWTGTGTQFVSLRDELAKMASGRRRCMYCEDSSGTDIDHFYPKAHYPDRVFDWINHFLSCADCNRRKGDRFSVDAGGEPTLVDPVSDEPLEHLILSPTTGILTGTTAKGRESIDVFSLNRAHLSFGRKDAWVALQELIVGYCAARRRGDAPRADVLADAIRRFSFAGVFVQLVRLSRSPASTVLLTPECRAALADCPDVETWVV